MPIWAILILIVAIKTILIIIIISLKNNKPKIIIKEQKREKEKWENKTKTFEYVEKEVKNLSVEMKIKLFKKGYLKKVTKENLHGLRGWIEVFSDEHPLLNKLAEIVKEGPGYYLKNNLEWKEIMVLYEALKADKYFIWVDYTYYGFDSLKVYLEFALEHKNFEEDEVLKLIQNLNKEEESVLLKEKFIEKHGNKYILNKEKREKFNNYWDSFNTFVEEMIEVLKKGE